MQFESYICQNGIATPENRNKCTDGTFVACVNLPDGPNCDGCNAYIAFETWKQSHTYATDAKDGCWTFERFEEPVWQFRNVKWEWVDCVRNDPSFSKANGFTTRQFAKFKEEVEKPKESARAYIHELVDELICDLTPHQVVYHHAENKISIHSGSQSFELQLKKLN